MCSLSKTLMMPRYAKSKWSTWRLAARSWPLINSTGNAPRPDAAPTGLQKIFTPFCMGGPFSGRSHAQQCVDKQGFRIGNMPTYLCAEKVAFSCWSMAKYGKHALRTFVGNVTTKLVTARARFMHMSLSTCIKLGSSTYFV